MRLDDLYNDTIRWLRYDDISNLLEVLAWYRACSVSNENAVFLAATSQIAPLLSVFSSFVDFRSRVHL